MLARSTLLVLALLTTALPAAPQQDVFLGLRRRMVEDQIQQRGVTQPAVLAAMMQVPRHLFVPEAYRDQAYADSPLPIGEGQTISQPYIVALMTSLVEVDRRDKVLEIGTGSGYQAAVLSCLAGEVYTIEILPGLGEQARRRLAQLGYRNVSVRIGDGYKGWPEKAPFDAIVVTAAPERVPAPLIAQLKAGGKLVIPVGSGVQDLQVITKTAQGTQKKSIIPVRFVPMTGEAQKKQ